MPLRRRFLCPLICAATFASLPGLSIAQGDPHATWRAYGGAEDGSQYSSLKLVNRSNVAHLKPVWTVSTGDAALYSFNPLVIGDTMYVLAAKDHIVALDAATGKQKWSYDIQAKTPLLTNRGLTYWQSKDGHDMRLIFAADNMLQEIHAHTGKQIETFGKNGRVDLREGMGRDPEALTLVQSYNPGRIFENLVIFGSATNEEYRSGPGDIRAFDVTTGQLVWTFHTVPHPGETGYETWPKDAWKTVGGANAWSSMAVDDKRGILYVPTASPKYNFYGANRAGNNLFGDSLLALDARTGKLRWYYQMVHHDIWDYDNPSTPLLMTVRHNGKPVDIVAEASKTGFLWVFDRVTGKPLWPVEERPVPKSPMPSEETSPTQPFPSLPAPFARQSFTSKDLSPYLTPEEHDRLKQQIDAARNNGLFTPPSTQNTVEMPGNNGGANFGGAAGDPARGWVYVVSKDLPAMLKLTLPTTVATNNTDESRGAALFATNCSTCHGSDRAGRPPAIPSLIDIDKRISSEMLQSTVHYGKGLMPAQAFLTTGEIANIRAYLLKPQLASTAEAVGKPTGDPGTLEYKSGFGFMFAESGLPVIGPPWTSLTAYDLNTGNIRWKIPLGEVPELAEKGITNTGSHFPKVDPVVTAGGLIFTGSRDRKIRAIDSATGKTLWEYEAPAALEGMPAIYESNGREYIVFCAAARATTRTHSVPGHPASQEPIHGSYIAFALPQ
jgi:quinoprotein glucose dehydrogenase